MYEILVKHYYDDPHTPHIQRILDNGEYYMRYALFKALIESMKDFEIQPVISDQPVVHEHMPSAGGGNGRPSSKVLGSQRWNKADEQQLIRMLRQKPMPPVRDMAHALHRTPKAIYSRTYVLKKRGVNVEYPKYPSRSSGVRKKDSHHHRWTPEEKQRLVELAKQGLDNKKIAKELGMRKHQVAAMRWDLMRNGHRNGAKPAKEVSA